MNKNIETFRPSEDETAGKHPFRRLFLDAMVTEESEGLKRVFHSPKKYKGNPIIVPEKPWEGTGIAPGGTVMWRGDEIWLRSKVWPKKCPMCIHTSKDGIHFTRPNLGLHEWEGSKDNNCGGGHGSIIKIRNPKNPQDQWGAYGFTGATFSEDALNWRPESATGKLFATSDVAYYFYDPYQDRYVSTYKTADRRHRAVGIAWSKDGYEWEKPIESAVFGADDYDPDPTQIYGMPVFPYQGVYIGLPWMYHARWMKYGKYESPQNMYEAQEDTPCTIDVQFAWSWNLISWNRTPDRKPFIALGEPGSWECEMVTSARNPVVVNDQLYFYYAGYATPHDYLEAVSGGGLAILRMDGFCSMHASKQEGWFISQREVFKTPVVTINAKCANDGYVVAELVDRNNNVVPGFSRKDCVPFTGDSIRHELTWKKSAFASDWIEPDKKVRFFIKNADLYSYLPSDIDTVRDTGKRP